MTPFKEGDKCNVGNFSSVEYDLNCPVGTHCEYYDRVCKPHKEHGAECEINIECGFGALCSSGICTAYYS